MIYPRSLLKSIRLAILGLYLVIALICPLLHGELVEGTQPAILDRTIFQHLTETDSLNLTKSTPLGMSQARRKSSSSDRYMITWKKDTRSETIESFQNSFLLQYYQTKFNETTAADSSNSNFESVKTSLFPNQFHHIYAMNNVRGFSGHFDQDMLNELRAHPQIDLIERDHWVRVTECLDPIDMNEILSEKDPPSWGIDRIDQNDLPLNGEYIYEKHGGQGIDVYMIDSGLKTDHEEFENRATMGLNLLNPNDLSSNQDCSGHGSHVAGIIGGVRFGVAKKVNLIGIKVLDCENIGKVSDVVAAIQWIVEKHKERQTRISIINLSLITSYSAILNSAIEEAVNNNIVVVVAAGNGNLDACTTSPGSVNSAIRVGASTMNDEVAWFSNYGSCVDIFAPGLGIWSAGISDRTAIAYKSGTSMASPHVAGTMALWAHTLQNTTTNAAQFKDILQNLATRNTLTKMKPSTGNLLLFSNPQNLCDKEILEPSTKK